MFGSYVEDIMFRRHLLAVTKVPEPEKKLVHEVQTIYWLLAVNVATYAAGERSFSSAGPLKTWLRSRMDEERFSSLCFSRLSAIRVISVSKNFLRSLFRSLFLRSRALPAFRPNDREPGTGYSSLAVFEWPL